jgi:hypothetical protein
MTNDERMTKSEARTSPHGDQARFRHSLKISGLIRHSSFGFHYSAIYSYDWKPLWMRLVFIRDELP